MAKLHHSLTLPAAVAVAFFVIAIDQWLKVAMRSFLETHGEIDAGVIGMIIHENHGIVANIPLPTSFTLMVTALALALIGWMAIHASKRGDMVSVFFLALIIGGAISNAIDRIRFGYVFDWIFIFHSGVLNIADIAIGGGILLYLLRNWKAIEKRRE
jgi:lipoprotein signal peptidase